ncbi:MAG TPA: serine/threonine-protein kinase [Solirubrobacteraceae bacterium]|jgi:serine/threonine-protein kinase|nr:serine/threonine-protein kinase [Solirubrobacteraceae bacterium]
MRADAQPGGVGPGDLVDGYRIEEPLGEGGMGRVFRAVREADGETVALKVMKPGPAGDTERIRRFVREARAAATVDHRHLVGVLDSGECAGCAYLVMRYVTGGSLDARIRDAGQLPVEETISVVGDIAAGMDALHRAGVVHRDVKPSNVMLDERGAAALTDFGLAKGRDYSALTRQGQMLGTLDYIAPEMLRGADPGPPADIYALGCVTYECLTGRPPFGGRGMFAIGFAHLEEMPADPCAARDDLPAGAGEFVLQALMKDPADRPPTATAYATVLAAALRPGRS